MSQIQKKFIAGNAVDETKIRLSNNANLKARNAANSADVNIVKVNASDRIEFASVPQTTADASASNDLVRYSQIQNLLDGLKPKEAVKAATTAPGTLATSFEDGDSIDGYTLVTGDRLLIKDQIASEENGIYIVQASGAPVRSSDFNAPSEIPGSYTVAQFGTANAGTLYVCTSSPAVIDTDPILFVARATQTYTGGDMITLTGSAFSVDLATSSALESTNPGNAAGQLRVKVEASNPTLDINGSNELGVKFANGLEQTASGLEVNLSATGALEFQTSEIAINLEASNPSLQINGSNELGAKLNAAGAIVTGASGLSAQVDAATVKINGSNQLEALKQESEQITLSGTDITNQYVDLSFAAHSTLSISLQVIGGPVQTRGVDYTVSLTGGSGGVTRITFDGDLETGGAAALIAADILVINYSYL